MSKLASVLWMLAFIAACGKAMISGRVIEPHAYYKRAFDVTKEEAMDALRWSFRVGGYAISKEDKAAGLIETVWLPSKADSHYMKVFDSDDYGVSGAYYQLTGLVSEESGKVVVRIGVRTKSIIEQIRSAGVEEKKAMARVSDFLRKREPDITNIGLEE